MRNVHLSHGNQVRHRVVVSTGIMVVTAVSATALFGYQWATPLSVMGNCLVSLIWVWE